MKGTLVLAPREVQVLGLVADGRTDREIAKRLRISEETVATLLGRAMSRMNVTCRAGAVAVGYREGFLVRRLVVVRVPQMSPETARVLTLVAGGRSNRDIGLSLGIGEAAAASRVRWLLRAFGAVSRANLVKAAIDAGVLSTGLRLQDAARESAAVPRPSVAPLRGRCKALAIPAQPRPPAAPGGLLRAFLAAPGSKRGSAIPAEELDSLILAGIADGLGRAEVISRLEIATSAGRNRIERLSEGWGVRGDTLLIVEAYRRGILEPEPADPVTLTASELNLLALIAAYGSYLRIAELTGRKSDTVSDHAARLLRVLGARNAAHAIKRGYDSAGLADADRAAVVPKLVVAA